MKARLGSEYVNKTLSRGTLRDSDILEAVHYLLPKKLVKEARGAIKRKEKTSSDYYSARKELAQDSLRFTEIEERYYDALGEVGHLMDEIYEHLEEVAPFGCYFGGHPGDSSDIGFWQCVHVWMCRCCNTIWQMEDSSAVECPTCREKDVRNISMLTDLPRPNLAMDYGILQRGTFHVMGKYTVQVYEGEARRAFFTIEAVSDEEAIRAGTERCPVKGGFSLDIIRPDGSHFRKDI